MHSGGAFFLCREIAVEGLEEVYRGKGGKPAERLIGIVKGVLILTRVFVFLRISPTSAGRNSYACT